MRGRVGTILGIMPEPVMLVDFGSCVTAYVLADQLEPCDEPRTFDAAGQVRIGVVAVAPSAEFVARVGAAGEPTSLRPDPFDLEQLCREVDAAARRALAIGRVSQLGHDTRTALRDAIAEWREASDRYADAMRTRIARLDRSRRPTVRERLESMMREAKIDPERGWAMTLGEFAAVRDAVADTDPAPAASKEDR